MMGDMSIPAVARERWTTSGLQGQTSAVSPVRKSKGNSHQDGVLEVRPVRQARMASGAPESLRSLAQPRSTGV